MTTRHRVPLNRKKRNKKYCNKLVVCFEKCQADCTKMRTKESFSEMFGINNQYNKFSVQNIAKMNLKHRLFQCFLFVLFIILLYIFFYAIDPPHFELSLPKKEDIGRHALLREESTILQRNDILVRVVGFLEESCEVFRSSYTLLFCHNILTNDMPIMEPCFMDCRDKQFYYDLDIEKTENKETIICNEIYGELQSKKTRIKNIVVRGVRNLELEQFSNIPNSSLESCIFQHGIEIASGNWKA